MSFLVLRLLVNKLPLDSNLHRFNIHGPSKCFCCASHHQESLDHIFSSGDFANQIWQFFDSSLGFSSYTSSIKARLLKWWILKPKNIWYAFTLKILPILICWCIWKARNQARFEGSSWPVNQALNFIAYEFIAIFQLNFPSLKLVNKNWLSFTYSLDSFTRQYSFTLTRWILPPQGRLKLNTDGCSRGNPGHGGGGAVLRNADGRFIFGIASYFASVSSFEAEVKALALGLQQCAQRGFKFFQIETDSSTLIAAIKKRQSFAWSCKMEFSVILDHLHLAVDIRHCFREANQVADGLANFGCDLKSTIYFTNFRDLPILVRGSLNLDRAGVCTIRRRLS